MLFPHVQSNNEHNPEVIHGFEISDMIQSDIYSLYKVNLKLMIMFLMITHSLMTMMTNQICLKMNSKNLQNEEINIIIRLDQFMGLKNYIEIQDRQHFNQPTKFLKYLIFPDLTLFTTLLRYLMTNQIPLCISTNQKRPTETLETKWPTTNTEKKLLSFHPITFLSE